MNKRSLGVLIALNLALVVALAVVNLTPAPAHGQGFGAAGDYVMLAGQVKGRSAQSGIYIIELQTARMVAVMFNSNSDELETIAGRNLLHDTQGPREQR